MDQHHPDSHELDNWPLIWPENPDIARFVTCLALDYGLRLHEIEDVILQALRDRVTKEALRQHS